MLRLHIQFPEHLDTLPQQLIEEFLKLMRSTFEVEEILRA